ncbi:hypothetical protein [Streptomyces sp. G45]
MRRSSPLAAAQATWAAEGAARPDARVPLGPTRALRADAARPDATAPP